MVDKCPRCNVTVDSSLKNCPLCGAYIERDVEKEENFATTIDYGYPKVSKNLVIKKLALKIVVYLCVISIGVCLLVNYLTSPTQQLDWSYHIIFGWIVYWCTLGRTMFFHLEIKKQIYWYSVFACLICFHIQYSIERTFDIPMMMNWALLYATPAFLMGGIAGLFIYSLFIYRDWERCAMPMSAMCLTTIFPVIMGLAIYGEVHFMLYISLGVGIATLLLMMILGKEKYFLELKKKYFI